jgi:peptidoglycan/xylan/chitin deacetylase (PgdA/CDA1 family)
LKERLFAVNKSVGRSFYATLALLVFLLFAVSMLAGTKAVVAGRDENRLVNLIDVPILNYHKVATLQHPLSMLPEDFEKQMAYLQDNDYHTITPDQLMAYLKFAKPLPDKPIMITFDDGYRDNFTNAFPIMQKYGFTGTIFLATGLVNQDERFLTWDQVRQMKQAGFVFGSHTVNHVNLTKLGAEQIQAELTESRDEMEAQLGEKPRYFAYPTGAYNLQIEQMVRQAGYRAAFTIRYGQVGADSDPYALERIPIFQSTKTFRSFLIRLNGATLLERMGIIRN